MPKKTARRTASRPTVSRATQGVGLIATANKPPRSARTKSAVDNRSHRTYRLPDYIIDYDEMFRVNVNTTFQTWPWTHVNGCRRG